MPRTEKAAPTRSMRAVAGEFDVLDEANSRQHDADDHELQREADAPREEGGDEAADERADRGRDGRRGADQGVDARLRRALEVAVDERLHGRQQQRGAQPAEDGPEDDDRPDVLGEHHRRGADRIAQQAQHVGAACGR